MVNVAGRSKGCTTCRRRKKGCDQGRPSCSRCLKEGLKCEGYDKSRIWVTYEPQNGEKSRVVNKRPIPLSKERKHKKPPERTQEWTFEASPIGYLRSSSSSPTRLSSLDFLSSSSSSTSHEEVPLLPNTLIQTSLETLAFSAFWQEYLPKGKFNPVYAGQTQGSLATAESVVTLCGQSDTLRMALAAVSFSCIGRKEMNIDVLRQGTKFYGLALTRLNWALQESWKARADDVIPTVLLLSAYEQFSGFAKQKPPSSLSLPASSSPAASWQAHASGVSKLMLLRAPEDYGSSPNMHNFFSDCRMQSYAIHFFNRKACPLDDPAWRSHPWDFSTKTTKDRLFDVLLAIPGLMERYDSVMLATKRDETRKLGLIRELLAVHQLLQDWKGEVIHELGIPESGGAAGEEDPEVFMSYGIDIANSFMLYWASNAAICSVMHVLNTTLLPTHSLSSFLTGALNPDIYATNVVKCAHIFFEPDAGLVGPQHASWSIGVVSLCYALTHDKQPPESMHIQNLLDGKGGTYSELIGNFVRGMGGRKGEDNVDQAWIARRTAARKKFHIA